MPPDEDDVTDEGSDDDEDTLPKDPNHLGRGVLSQRAELVLHNETEELPEIKDELEEPIGAGEPQPGPSTPRTPRQGRGEKPVNRVRCSRQEDEEEDGNMDEDEDEEEAGPGKAEQLARYLY